ncbi:histamine H2 receptor-like [Acanthaster planci]|uniref:Histamine H2 receptor-like n=1 Tax=Acanthaster planci TaxID=133434 RepID=A0A8B7XNV2_ACAPL|nr:histamine H2 receptor-like [Acanthaster planci]
MSNSSIDPFPTSTISPFLIALRTCFITFLGLLIIAGNILSITVTHRVTNLAESTKVLMTSLAVYDLLIGITTLFSIISSAMDRWPFGELSCHMMSAIKSFVSIMSLQSMINLNIERYIAVVWPYKFPLWCTRRRVIILILGVSILSLIQTVLLTPLYGIKGTYISAAAVCFPSNNSEIINILTILSVSILPTISMIFIYYRLIKISRQHERRNNRNGPNEAADMQNNKALKTFFMVTLSFVCCYTPYLVARLVEYYSGKATSDLLSFLVISLYIVNSVFNVFIYCLFNQTYRRTAKKIITEKLQCCKRTAVGPVNT